MRSCSTVILWEKGNPVSITQGFWELLDLFVIIRATYFGLFGFLKQEDSFINFFKTAKVFYWGVRFGSIEVPNQDRVFTTCREWVNNFLYTFHMRGYNIFCWLYENGGLLYLKSQRALPKQVPKEKTGICQLL